MKDELINQSFNTEELYAEFFTPVFRYMFFRTRNYDIASDLAQSCFLKFLVQKNPPKEKEHAIRLLFVIARTTLIDYWRFSGKRNFKQLVDIDDINSLEPNPESQAISKEDTEFIREIFSNLGEPEAEILSLRLSSNLDYKTIGETLNISAENARKIYSRTLKKIEGVLRDSKRF